MDFGVLHWDGLWKFTDLFEIGNSNNWKKELSRLGELLTTIEMKGYLQWGVGSRITAPLRFTAKYNSRVLFIHVCRIILNNFYCLEIYCLAWFRIIGSENQKHLASRVVDQDLTRSVIASRVTQQNSCFTSI